MNIFINPREIYRFLRFSLFLLVSKKFQLIYAKTVSNSSILFVNEEMKIQIKFLLNDAFVFFLSLL
jgi:hypothetical protein